MAEQKKVQEQDINQLLKVRREKLAELQQNGKDPFQITKYDVTHHSTDIKEGYDELEGASVSVAGRMMFKRVMGKASFCNLLDLKGNIQIYVARDSIGEDSYKDFKKYDVGDILGISGEVFKTKTGEISIHASSVTLLSKSLQILPEKFHGLTDTDTRYRRKVPRPDQHRAALPPAVCGPDHESGRQGHVYQTLQGNQQHTKIPGRTGIYGSGDADACLQCRRCGGTAV